MRPYQLATAAVLVLIAAVAMFDTRSGALPDPTGGVPGGVRSGWYPFWSGMLIVISGALVAYRALTVPQAVEGAFRDRRSISSVVQLIVPMVAATYLMTDRLLGFYLSSGLYMAYFARFTTRYRWYWALASGVITPLAVFLVFEIGFRALFPKSFLYPTIPF